MHDPHNHDQHNEDDVTRATARLPGLQIDIVHRRSREGETEQISINLQAVPSFEAFSRYLDQANPFALWAQAVQTAWLPWFGIARRLMLPWAGPSAPSADTDYRAG